MPSETVNETVERIREHEQPKHMNKILQSLSVGFHLKCLRCGSTYYHTCFAMSEMSYRMYSYCPDCIDKAIQLLKKKDQVETALSLMGKKHESMERKG